MDSLKKERLLYGGIILLILMNGIQFCTKNSGSDKSIYFSNKNKEEIITYLDSVHQSNIDLQDKVLYLSKQLNEQSTEISALKSQSSAILSRVNALQNQTEVLNQRRKRD